ncbi:hypothetical protein [Arcticibacter tournemirensis]
MKSLILKSFILIIFIITSKVSLSQKNYQPGYLISVNGDTVKGFIDYRNWEKNPDKITFKKSNTPESSYTPELIKEFGVKNEIYVSAIVNVEVSPFKTENLNYSAETTWRQDTAFLQTLVAGEKSLYYYKDRNGKQQYFIRNGKDVDLLLFKQYLVKNENGVFISANKQYLQQLEEYLSDCPAAISDLSRVSYNTTSLTNLFTRYYNCKKSGIAYQKKKDKVRIEIGGLAGPSFTAIDFESSIPAYAYIDKADFPHSVNPSAGAYFDVILPRNQGKWSINNELFFTSYRSESNYVDYSNDENFTNYSIAISSLSLKINNLLRFKFPVSAAFFYINAGISNGFSISEKNDLKKERRFYTTEEIEYLKALNPSRKHEQGILLGVGSKFSKYSLEARYEHGNGMADSENISSKTSRFYILLGYKFR